MECKDQRSEVKGVILIARKFDCNLHSDAHSVSLEMLKMKNAVHSGLRGRVEECRCGWGYGWSLYLEEASRGSLLGLLQSSASGLVW